MQHRGVDHSWHTRAVPQMRIRLGGHVLEIGCSSVECHGKPPSLYSIGSGAWGAAMAEWSPWCQQPQHWPGNPLLSCSVENLAQKPSGLCERVAKPCV